MFHSQNEHLEGRMFQNTPSEKLCIAMTQMHVHMQIERWNLSETLNALMWLAQEDYK